MAINNWNQALGYDTQRVVRVLDWRLGAMRYALMSVLLAYVLLYALLYRQAYDFVDESTGTIVTKIKGHAYATALGRPLARGAAADTSTPRVSWSI